jgi:hypothetical protein
VNWNLANNSMLRRFRVNLVIPALVEDRPEQAKESMDAHIEYPVERLIEEMLVTSPHLSFRSKGEQRP